MDETGISELIMAGRARRVPSHPYRAEKLLLKADSELLTYIKDYRDLGEVTGIFGEYIDREGFEDLDLGEAERAAIFLPEKRFRPNMDINHRVWRQYTTIRLCIDALLTHKGMKTAGGIFAGLFRGDRMIEKIEIARVLLEACGEHFDNVVSMKKRWAQVSSRYEQGFQTKEVNAYFKSCLAIYFGVSKACSHPPVLLETSASPFG